MDNGWIKLHRKSLESIIFTNEKGWKIWTWCLLKANHEENTFYLGRTKLSVKPGQFVMGRNTASGELAMAVGTIWYWLDILEKEGNIERKATNKYTIITIPKWKDYQVVERKQNANRTQIEQQIEPNKNDKNENNDKNTTKVVGEPSYGKPEINQLWEYGQTLGFATTKQTLNRYCINRLLKGKTVEQLKKAAEISQQIRNEAYAPQINNWLDLEEKYLKLRDFFVRQAKPKESKTLIL